MRLLRLLLALGVAGALLAGCGSGSDSDAADEEPWTFQALHLALDGHPGPETAGVLMAHKLGYFEELGLGLEISSPVEPDRPVGYVTSKSVDVSITNEPQVVLAQENGAPVVAVGALVPEPTLALIWLEKSKIEGVADLEGKTIAIPGVPFQEAFLETVLARAGLQLSDVKLKRSSYDLVDALAGGRADAIFGGSWNVEGAELEHRGLKPVSIRAAELGIPPYDELVVIARSDRVEKEPELFRRFMAAVRKGAAAALRDPEAVAEAIERPPYGSPELRPAKASLTATLPLLSKTGRIGTEQAGGLIAWMHEEGLIERQLPASALIGP